MSLMLCQCISNVCFYVQSPIDRKKQLTAIRDERKSPDSADSSPLGSPLCNDIYCM